MTFWILVEPISSKSDITMKISPLEGNDVVYNDTVTVLESYAKKMLKMFWVLIILFVNLMSSRLFPVFVYKICVQLPYYTSLWHFLFHRYDGFSFKLIFQKIQKLEVIFKIFCCGKILFNKMSFNFAI